MNDDWYARELTILRAKPDVNEAEVIQALIRPVLKEALSLTTVSLHVEVTKSDQGRQRRPDLIVHHPDARDAELIVEAKGLGTDLMRRTGPRWTTAPLGQLQEYLEKYRTAGPDTVGIVTNGTEWIVLRRQDGLAPLHEAPQIIHAETWESVSSMLQGALAARPGEKKKLEQPSASDWLASLSECKSPTEWLQSVTDKGNAKDIASLSHELAVVKIAEHKDDTSLFEKPVHLCCMQKHFPDGEMSTEDILQTLTEHKDRLTGRIVGVAYLDAHGDEPGGTVRRCRAFIQEDERLLSTALVDAELPGSRARSQIESLALEAANESPRLMLKRFSTTPLHESFHVEIGRWFERTRQSEHELRHLIRVLFTWLLQTRDILPDSALWPREHHASTEPEGSIHAHVEWLFTGSPGSPPRRSDPHQPRASVADSASGIRTLSQRLPVRQAAPGRRAGEAPQRHVRGSRRFARHSATVRLDVE